MSLSRHVESGLEIAQKNQETYTPKPEIVAELSKKVLLMLVGPAVSGKTTVIESAASMDSEFTAVKVVTTREARPDDDDNFYYVPHDDKHLEVLLDSIDAGELVQYVVHPETGRIYATRIEDYPSTYNMLPTLSGSVSSLRNAGFKRTHTFGLVNEPAIWASRFSARYPIQNQERRARLREAADSVRWLLTDRQVEWLENVAGKPNVTARSLINRSMTADEYTRMSRLLVTIETMA